MNQLLADPKGALALLGLLSLNVLRWGDLITSDDWMRGFAVVVVGYMLGVAGFTAANGWFSLKNAEGKALLAKAGLIDRGKDTSQTPS